MAAPLGNLILDHECGYNLVKALLERLWHDCRTSLKRRQTGWLLRKKAQLQHQRQQLVKSLTASKEDSVMLGGSNGASAAMSRKSDVNMDFSDASSVLACSQAEQISSINDFQRQFKSFSKFVDLTFGVFPLKTNAIEKVIKLIFSEGGIFKCIEEGYE